MLGPGMSLIPSYLCSCSLASCSRGMGGSLDQWAEETEGVSTVVLPRTFPMLTSMKSSGFPICLSSSSVQADVKVARENQTSPPDASASIGRLLEGGLCCYVEVTVGSVQLQLMIG